MHNDARGWMLSCASGAACILGSSIIYVDVIAQKCFGVTDFRISENNTFLCSSLSLSAGVMLFTSIYHMLPESENYLKSSGLAPPTAAYISILLFVAGAVAINLFSNLIHRYIPSTIVGCSHTHGPPASHEAHDHVEQPELRQTETVVLELPTETTSLLPRNPSALKIKQRSCFYAFRDSIYGCCGIVKSKCDDTGPCLGVSQACGQECTRIIHHEPLLVAVPERGHHHQHSEQHGPEHHHHHHHHQQHESHSDTETFARAKGHDDHHLEAGHHTSHYDHVSDQKRHHHHVPSNPFLTLGVQTSLAISLHKLPEGFITYAANHANPNLGLSVFMSLFIHNICEGLAMALPLYLALQSRVRAMMYASILGGLSQPLGAGIAAIWFSNSKQLNGQHQDDNAHGTTALAYGILFSVTSGIMTYVGLQLYTEATSLTHSHAICVRFAIAGMCLLGLGQALLK